MIFYFFFINNFCYKLYITKKKVFVICEIYWDPELQSNIIKKNKFCKHNVPLNDESSIINKNYFCCKLIGI